MNQPNPRRGVTDEGNAAWARHGQQGSDVEFMMRHHEAKGLRPKYAHSIGGRFGRGGRAPFAVISAEKRRHAGAFAAAKLGYCRLAFWRGNHHRQVCGFGEFCLHLAIAKVQTLHAAVDKVRRQAFPHGISHGFSSWLANQHDAAWVKQRVEAKARQRSR